MPRVLIVGAGPTGLTLALCLVRYGIQFDVVDGKTGASRDSKALAINPLSLHQLELLGYRDAIGAQACRVRRANIRFESMRLNPLDLRWLDHDHNFFLTQPQSVTESELASALERAGGVVDWQTELIGLTPEPAGVNVALRGPGGAIRRHHYDYVVGCDGKRSVVRASVGGDFLGAEYPMHFVLGDFDLAWDGDPQSAHYFVYDDTFFVFVPVLPRRWRVVVKHDGPPHKSGLVAEAITEPVRRRFGRDIFRSGPSWLSQAPLYHKLATRLRSDRLFIAGDAAHLFSPIGGTGMNTGMQDAVNLGWKLSFEISGRARPGVLLGSYEPERLEAIKVSALATDAATRLIARVDRAPERVAPFIPRPRNRRFIARQLPLAQSGLALRYTTSAALSPVGDVAARSRVGSVCAGMLGVIRALGTAGRTPPFYVLSTDGPDAGGPEMRRLGEVCARFPSSVRQVAVGPRSPDASPASPADDGTAHVGLEADAWRRLGIAAGTVIVVRPDGIISYDGPGQAPERLEEHLTSLLAA